MEIKKIIDKIKADKDSFSEMRTGSFNNLDKLFIISIIVITALLYIPMVGNYYMFDPWENHYSQVAWETLKHHSFAQLWYRNTNHFWSKPPLLFWLMMPFFKIHISEFMGRLPVSLFSVGSLAFFYILLTRLFTRKTALFSTFVLMMSPMYFQLSRHIMVDLPFIGLNMNAMLALSIYYFTDFKEGEKTKIGFGKIAFFIPKRDFFLYLFYFLEGWAFLAKGLLSIAVPGAAFLIYMIITGDFGAYFSWKNLKKHLIGTLIYLAVAMAWLGYMWVVQGTLMVRTFIIFHHFKRALGEIHKPNSVYTLYIRMLGYATFPWIAFLPAAIYRFFNSKHKLFAYKKHIFFFSMLIGPFFFYAYQSTKFDHYIAPLVPVVAILVGYYFSTFSETKWTIGKKIEMMTSIFILGAVARDIGNDFRIFAHIITFYHNRSVHPIHSFIPVMAVIFGLFGLILFIQMFSHKLNKFTIPSMFALMGLFMTYYFAFAMPDISRSYCLKPLIDTYKKLSPEREPIADYYKWLRRSSSFWLQNKITFLKEGKENEVMNFFKTPGDKYVIMKTYSKPRFVNLMKRIHKKVIFIKRVYKNYLAKVVGPGEKIDMQRAMQYVVKNPPADMVKSGAVFDGVIELLGYKILNNIKKENGKLFVEHPGMVEVDLYFKALKNHIAKNYTVFLHCEGDKKDKRTKGDKAMADGNYPTTYWKKGQIIRHRLSIYIPPNSKNNYYIPYVGIYQEDYRASITNFEDVKNDGNNRLELMKIWLKK